MTWLLTALSLKAMRYPDKDGHFHPQMQQLATLPTSNGTRTIYGFNKYIDVTIMSARAENATYINDVLSEERLVFTVSDWVFPSVTSHGSEMVDIFRQRYWDQRNNRFNYPKSTACLYVSVVYKGKREYLGMIFEDDKWDTTQFGRHLFLNGESGRFIMTIPEINDIMSTTTIIDEQPIVPNYQPQEQHQG